MHADQVFISTSAIFTSAERFSVPYFTAFIIAAFAAYRAMHFVMLMVPNSAPERHSYFRVVLWRRVSLRRIAYTIPSFQLLRVP